MIKLTTLDGGELRVRADAINAVEEAEGPWRTKNAGALIEYSGTVRAVRETVTEVIRLLSYR